MPRKKYLIGAAALAVLGAGVAEAATAKLHTMKVDAPDGAVVEVRYAGNVAPQVKVVPASEAAQFDAAMTQPDMTDPFAQMDRVSAMMDAQMHAMMQRAAILQRQAAVQMQQAAANGQVTQMAPGVTFVGTMPKGAHFSYVSTTSDANGCTRTVSYSSDGTSAPAKVTQAASDGCSAVHRNTAPIPAKVEAPAPAPAPVNENAVPGTKT